MMPSFEFDGYTLRPATEEDLPLARAWNAGDPDHVWEAGQERYWIEQRAGVESYLLEDALGPVFFFKILTIAETLMGGVSSNAVNCGARTNAKAVEVSIQFAPDGGAGQLRTMTALSRGFAWLEKRLSAVGVKAVYFNSKNLLMIRFALIKLGFTEVENDYEPAKMMGFRRFKKEL